MACLSALQIADTFSYSLFDLDHIVLYFGVFLSYR